MDKEKLQTGAMMNPKCQKCSKKDTCNNKTLCAYLIPKKIKIDKVSADAQLPLTQPLKLTPEMVRKQLIENMTKLSIRIDVGLGYSKQGYMKGEKENEYR